MPVSVTDAFTTFQGVVNADVEHVREARARRDLFKSAFTSEGDVNEVVASGSLARGTHKDPIHDVDVTIVFDDAQHAEWGEPGSSAEDALDYTRKRVNALLGITNGTFDRAVRLARWRNHALKCFLDDPMIQTPSPLTRCLPFVGMANSSSLKHPQGSGSTATRNIS
jgi:predicted nucleotidyltransferase